MFNPPDEPNDHTTTNIFKYTEFFKRESISKVECVARNEVREHNRHMLRPRNCQYRVHWICNTDCNREGDKAGYSRAKAVRYLPSTTRLPWLWRPRKWQDREQRWKQKIGAESFVDGQALKIKLSEKIGTIDFEGSVFIRGSFCKVLNNLVFSRSLSIQRDITKTM